MLTQKNLLYLREKQVILDQYIMNKRNLVIDNELLKRKVIAFLVEVSEFINEHRAFKFWSNKGPSEKNVMLEELVDCLHFLISLGTNVDFDFGSFKSEKSGKKNIDNWVIDVYKKALAFEEKFDISSYHDLLDEFLSISFILEIKNEEILDTYNKKNEVNFQRQDTNY